MKEEDKLRPVANVLEGAKRTGRATGIVATAEIQHATPAGFSAHHVNRKILKCSRSNKCIKI